MDTAKQKLEDGVAKTQEIAVEEIALQNPYNMNLFNLQFHTPVLKDWCALTFCLRWAFPLAPVVEREIPIQSQEASVLPPASEQDREALRP